MPLDKQLSEKISKANNNSLNNKEYETLSSNVDYFVETIQYKDYFENSKFYFIKNAKNKYVGIVQDGGNDLHWYILPHHRGNGYLTNALRETILPHLLIDKVSQCITINEGHISKKMADASEKVALSVGFKKIWDKDHSKIFILNKSEAPLG